MYRVFRSFFFPFSEILWIRPLNVFMSPFKISSASGSCAYNVCLAVWPIDSFKLGHVSHNHDPTTRSLFLWGSSIHTRYGKKVSGRTPFAILNAREICISRVRSRVKFDIGLVSIFESALFGLGRFWCCFYFFRTTAVCCCGQCESFGWQQDVCPLQGLRGQSVRLPLWSHIVWGL